MNKITNSRLIELVRQFDPNHGDYMDGALPWAYTTTLPWTYAELLSVLHEVQESRVSGNKIAGNASLTQKYT